MSATRKGERVILLSAGGPGAEPGRIASRAVYLYAPGGEAFI
jgi:hypothetical protein